MRISQELPGLGAPPAEGAGAMPMAAPPAMPGAPPAEGAAPASTFKIIYSPLDSLGKILADLDFKTYLQNNFGDDQNTLAHKIWIMYGGPENEIGTGKPGKRQSKPATSDPAELERINTEEYNNTRERRWERLPAGVSIDSITNLQALQSTIEGGFIALVKQNSQPAAAAAKQWLKMANEADLSGKYLYADSLQVLIKDVYSL